MKYSGSILDFTKERNDDLMKAFRHHLAKANFIIMPDIFELVAHSPSSRFWVSEKRASIIIARMLSKKPLPKMRANKREMFEEIFKRFTALQKRFPHKSIPELTSIVVNQPAPKFYLTPRTVGQFIYKIKNGWYDRQPDRNRQDFRRE